MCRLAYKLTDIQHECANNFTVLGQCDYFSNIHVCPYEKLHSKQHIKVLTGYHTPTGITKD